MNINELKNKILQLAIQGKLVPQDDNDIPASVLLEEIKKEKEQLIKEKKIKREKPLPEITEEEKPFELPKGWKLAYMQDITSCITCGVASTPKYVEKGKMFLSAKNVKPYRLILDDYKYVSEEDYEKYTKQNKPECNDILLTRVGAGIGEATVIDRELDFAIYVSLTLIKPIYKFINSKYLLHWLNSPQGVSKSIGDTLGNGFSQGNLNVNQVRQFIIPIPPLAEQDRIVSKVDELFEIIDELSENKESMLKNISDTRNKVLQLAIQGKLVEKSPDDIPVSVLLEEIRKEKEQLIKEKKIKKEKPLPEITEEDKLFEIPKGWEWVRLGNIANIIMGQSPDSSYVSEDKNGIEFHQGKTAFGKKILDKSGLFCEKPTKVAEAGDILLSVRAPVGAVNFTDREVCIGRGLTAIRAINNKDNRFIFYIIKALEKELIGKATGTTFLAISSKEIKELVMPLPSVEEQLRIVQKVDEIMAYLDELEKTILNDSII